MNGNDIRPTTIVGIKRLANAIRKSEGVRHWSALDTASRRAGFANFRNAQAILGTDRALHPGAKHTVLLTAYWRNPRGIEEGRETLELSLTQPWSAVITPREVRWSRALDKFRGKAADHLVSRTLYREERIARQALCAAARELQFMDATGLRPAAGRRLLRPRLTEELPGADHTTNWVNVECGIDVIVDEPYPGAMNPQRLAQRAAWAAKHGFYIEEVTWPGMYAPDVGSVMFIALHETSVSHLGDIRAAIEAIPEPVIAERWSGVSGPFRPAFRSPQELQAGYRAIAPIDPFLCRNTEATRIIGYGLDRTRRRPNGRMPIATHEEIGAILKTVIGRCGNRDGVRTRVDRVRSMLDTWLQHEDTAAELDNERFFDVYYHGTLPMPIGKTLPVAEREQLLNDLERVRDQLVRHYPNCAPLRAVLKYLDAALKSIHNWGFDKAGRKAA